jgi:stage IV sporulation protein FB
VLIAEPPPTPFDFHFGVLGFPVRVHPLFWLVGLMIGFHGGPDAGIQLLIWFVAFFSSILIHELGHAMMLRRFGRPAHIVLYAMGGLAIEGRPRDFGSGSPWSLDSYSGFQPRQRTPQEQILISAAGPGIQFVLLGVVIAIVYATGGAVEFQAADALPVLVPHGGKIADVRNLQLLLSMLLQINLWWPIINLLPVLPLDGGQIALQVFIQQDPWGGTQRALWLSVIAGGAMAAFSLFVMHGNLLTAMLFASLAFSSYMTLQQMGGGRNPW